MKQEPDILIEVNHVSKKFSKNLKKSLVNGLKDIFFSLIGAKRNTELLGKDEFWAVKDISFQLRRGECLGLIGHNGAGKSTLLKMLNGLIKPDQGEIIMRGKIGALIELGAGFNPILTGRENIYINGQILGFSTKEIDERFDKIVEFAEIGDFLNTPLQNYSSGMKIRLGFAVASQTMPDVLIIDEVLAVGDNNFKIKCLNRISEILPETAVIFVSHSMPQVAKVSSKVLLMNGGKCQYYGSSITKGLDFYFSNSKFGNTEITYNKLGKVFVSVQSSEFKDLASEQINEFALTYGTDFSFNCKFDFPTNHGGIYNFVMRIFDINLTAVGVIQNQIRLEEKFVSIEILVPELQLSPGNYIFDFFISKQNDTELGENLFYVQKKAFQIKVVGGEVKNYAAFQLKNKIFNVISV